MATQAVAVEPGDRGVDRDAEDPAEGRVVVVNVPEQRANEYVIFEEPTGRAWTVAEDNDPEVVRPVVPSLCIMSTCFVIRSQYYRDSGS